MDNFMIAIIAILVTSFISRRINQKAVEQLPEDQKANLVTLFSKSGMYRFGVLVAVLGLYFLNIKFNWIDQSKGFFLFVIFILTFLIGSAIATQRKLKANNFPQTYIKQNLLSSAIRLLGLVGFFVILKFL